VASLLLLLFCFSESTESRLVKQLLENYDKTLRPVWNASTTTHIALNPELNILISTDETQESITFVLLVGMVSKISAFRIFFCHFVCRRER
jgi:hypothetical protein